MPERIQLRRTRGWRKPEGAVVVSRPSRWGNPFKVGEGDPEKFLGLRGSIPRPGIFEYAPIETPERAVECFRSYARGKLMQHPDWLAPLRGRDLACWCPPGQPCHADVLLELANTP